MATENPLLALIQNQIAADDGKSFHMIAKNLLNALKVPDIFTNIEQIIEWCGGRPDAVCGAMIADHILSSRKRKAMANQTEEDHQNTDKKYRMVLELVKEAGQNYYGVSSPKVIQLVTATKAELDRCIKAGANVKYVDLGISKHKPSPEQIPKLETERDKHRDIEPDLT